MKTIRSYLLFLALLLSPPMGNAQFFEKLKKVVTGEERTMPTEKLSGLDQKFRDWDLGEVQIIAISVFSDNFEKHRQPVGTIKADGSFELNLPDSLKTWVPVKVYGKDCENADEATIENAEAKMAWNRMFVYKDKQFLGEISPANPVKAAYNLNGGVNNGKLGKYYLWVYVDGDASATIDCTKIMDVTDGGEYTYEDMEVKDDFDLHYKKGWNIVEVHNIDNIWVGLTKHYLERKWKVVDELPKGTQWVFRPRINEKS